MNDGNGDPLWRQVAYWSVLVSFFAMPLLMLVVHLVLWDDRKTLIGEFRWLSDFHKVLAALLIAMLGFNSFDRRNNGSKK